MRLVEISVFPVKSCRGMSVESAAVEARGLSGDRRWVIADPSNRGLTQRDIPALARLLVEPLAAGSAGLRLSFEGESIDVPVPSTSQPRIPVSVWADTLALPEAGAASEWLSLRLTRPVRLFHQPDDARRPVADWAEPGDHVSLADAFPVLIATTASLDAVRKAAGGSFGMERFRPNLVIDGTPAWAEDGWARIRIGGVELDLVKPCARCVVTTVDQEQGVFAGDEPLDTLRRIRLSGDRRVPGVLFGWNAVPRRFGDVRLGDAVEVLSPQALWPILPERRRA
jgi:uncharacterized protein YcbX